MFKTHIALRAVIPFACATLVGASTFFAANDARAADPNPDALSQIDWAMHYCGMALDPSTRRDDIEGHFKKFKEKRDLAIAADPAIKTWDGSKRGKKVSEWLPRCEKEISERVARDNAAEGVKRAVEATLAQCRKAGRSVVQADLDEYKKLRAAAVATNKSENFTIHLTTGDDVNAMIAKCDKDFPAAVAAQAKAEADSKARNAKIDQDNRDRWEAEAKAKAAKIAAERASLKGDRLKIYDKYGAPFRVEGGDSLPKSKQWKWNEHFERGLLEGWCQTTVTFKGNKKVSEKESGYGCKLR